MLGLPGGREVRLEVMSEQFGQGDGEILVIGGVFDIEPDRACAAAENAGDICGHMRQVVGGEFIAYHNETVAPELIQHHAPQLTAFNCVNHGVASQFRMDLGRFGRA